MPNEDQAPDGLLTQTGITSEVYEDGDFHGHILLCDYDDGIGTTYEQMLTEIYQLEGPTVLLESSPGSYHVWNLCVRSINGLVHKKAELHDDPKHLCIGYRRGRWVLRLSAKYKPSGELYKPMPQIKDVWLNDIPQGVQWYGETIDKPEGISLPHLQLLRTLADWQDYDLPSHFDRYDQLGKATPTDTYLSFIKDNDDG